MNHPLVSIICLSYNHSKFVAEAIASVQSQDYDNIELIVVDDGSLDGSKEAIVEILSGTETTFISLEQSIGNCRAFNKGFRESKGDFIIDLAADDVLLPNRVSSGLKSFPKNEIGVNFCDSWLIDPSGSTFDSHYKRNRDGNLLEAVPQGLIYTELISRYFISPPTMMIRRTVLEELEGYDENLRYEDFDFWVRSARNWEYSFTDELLVKKRILSNSHSAKQFHFLSKYQRTTLEVCKKIKKLNKTREENEALTKRCWYEIRQCLRQGNLHLIPLFLQLI